MKAAGVWEVLSELNKLRNINGTFGPKHSHRNKADPTLLNEALSNLERSTFLSLSLLGNKVQVMLRPRRSGPMAW